MNSTKWKPKCSDVKNKNKKQSKNTTYCSSGVIQVSGKRNSPICCNQNLPYLQTCKLTWNISDILDKNVVLTMQLCVKMHYRVLHTFGWQQTSSMETCLVSEPSSLFGWLLNGRSFNLGWTIPLNVPHTSVRMVLSQMLSCAMISCPLALIVLFSLVFEAHLGFMACVSQTFPFSEWQSKQWGGQTKALLSEDTILFFVLSSRRRFHDSSRPCSLAIEQKNTGSSFN